ncbi:MAG: hypothetical protein EA383_12710 [Spirochaetaceae bacterium]|nr:MAG: hypothetical protein EA383_12710 [Spirochaetaceae bacterium]
MIRIVREMHILFLLLLLCAAPVLHALTEGLYRSNTVGMKLERLGPPDADRVLDDELPYVLRVRRLSSSSDGTVRHERILEGIDGVEARTVIETRGGRRIRETEYTDDGYEERVFNSDGLVERVTVHDSRGVLEERSYAYEGPRLLGLRSDHRDPDTSYRETFRYTSDGRLRSVTRVDATGTRRFSEYLFRDTTLVEEWHSDGREDLLIRYGSAGQIVRAEAYRGGELMEWERWEWARPAGTGPVVLSGRVTWDAGTGRTETYAFDGDGRVVTHTTSREGEVLISRRMTYESELLHSEETTRSDGPDEVIRYYHNEDGSLTRSERLRDGSMVRLREYGENERVWETRFIAGEPVLRIEFIAENRVREQVLQDGEVVRERHF